MKKVISGKIVYLRNLNVMDIDNGWLKWLRKDDVVKHMPYLVKKTKKGLVNYLKQHRLPHSKIFAICLLSNDMHIGNARLSLIDKKNGTASYGRLIGEKSFWEKGIGTESLNLLCIYAFDFLKLRKLHGAVMPNNIGSKKSGFNVGATIEGTWKDHVVMNGKVLDLELISILKSNFKRRYAKKHW